MHILRYSHELAAGSEVSLTILSLNGPTRHLREATSSHLRLPRKARAVAVGAVRSYRSLHQLLCYCKAGYPSLLLGLLIPDICADPRFPQNLLFLHYPVTIPVPGEEGQRLFVLSQLCELGQVSSLSLAICRMGSGCACLTVAWCEGARALNLDSVAS